MLDYATEYILWNNLNSITAKYAFVLEHFLDDDGNVSFNAAYHKKNYEMAVLGGFGDAQNMIVKVDPTLK
jgi:hypothetical protein